MTEATVVCEREFNAIIDGESFPFSVEWMQPAPDQNDWRCELVIHWPTGPAMSYAVGVDSTQALILAFYRAQTLLETGPWPVRWFDHPPGSLGLPGFDLAPPSRPA